MPIHHVHSFIPSLLQRNCDVCSFVRTYARTFVWIDPRCLNAKFGSRTANTCGNFSPIGCQEFGKRRIDTRWSYRRTVVGNFKCVQATLNTYKWLDVRGNDGEFGRLFDWLEVHQDIFEWLGCLCVWWLEWFCLLACNLVTWYAWGCVELTFARDSAL